MTLPDDRLTMTASRLSVVVVAPSGMATIRRTLACLAAQTVAESIEVVVVAPTAAEIDAGALGADVFAALRVVAVGPVRKRGEAAAVGVRAATAPIVSLLEDHSYPEPGWAAALLAAHTDVHAGTRVGVGPAVENANAGPPLSRINFWLTYASSSGPQAAGPRALLPWHNTSYRRDVLAAYGARLGGLLEWESNLQDDLLARGYELYFEPAARTHHDNVSGFRSTLGLQFQRGRFFGGQRAARERWPAWRRVVYAASMPLFPLMQLRHVAPDLRRIGVGRSEFALLGPSLAVVLAAMAVGEAVGYVAGAGDAPDRIETYELHREAHLSRRERREAAGQPR